MAPAQRARLRAFVSVAALACAGTIASTSFEATGPPRPAPTPVQLYRQFCGVCHAFAPARSAGFGSNSTGGLGTNGGPSFNQLRVPYSYTISAITEPTGGHEKVQRKMTPKQLVKVATYLANATRKNPLPALPTDG